MARRCDLHPTVAGFKGAVYVLLDGRLVRLTRNDLLRGRTRHGSRIPDDAPVAVGVQGHLRADDLASPPAGLRLLTGSEAMASVGRSRTFPPSFRPAAAEMPPPPSGGHVGDGSDRLRVVARSVAPAVTEEILSGGSIGFTRPDIMSFPPERRGVAELMHRQGYEALPRTVPTRMFDAAVAEPHDPDAHERLPEQYDTRGSNLVVYRGICDDVPGSAMGYAEQFLHGRHHVGYGATGGHGSNFATDFHVAMRHSAAYLDSVHDSHGAMIRAVVPADARLLLVGSVHDSGRGRFQNISEYAVAHGYDGMMWGRRGDWTVVVLNRSVLVVDETPRRVYVADVRRVLTDPGYAEEDLRRDLFAGDVGPDGGSSVRAVLTPAGAPVDG